MRATLCGMVLALLGACADPDDIDAPLFAAPGTALPYDVALLGMPTPDLTALAERSLSLYRLQADGVASPGLLRRRATDDIATLQKLLRANGYYASTVEVAVEGDPQAPEADPAPGADAAPDPTTTAPGQSATPGTATPGTGAPTDALPVPPAARATDAPLAAAPAPAPDAAPPPRARAVLRVDPGPLYTLARHDLTLTGAEDPPALDVAALGSPVGGPALAAPIVQAENAATARLQATGFAYAAPAGRQATADRDQATLQVTSTVFAGPRFSYGPLQFQGLENVDPAYLASYADWTPGAPVDLASLGAFQQALAGTQLFDAVTAAPPETPPDPTGPLTPLPIVVAVTEALPQTVTAGLRFDTDAGPGLRGTYQHRNLAGSNETIDASAEVALDLQRLGVSYREPQYLRPGQDRLAGLALTRETDDAFDAATATATYGFERRLSPLWVAGLGGLAEFSDITGGTDQGTVYLAGLPGFASYDRTDDPLNPTRGQRARLQLTPFVGSFDGALAAFLSFDATASTYHDITGDGLYILAARGRLGTILSDSLDIVPPTRRLYAGGGGSVRGYANRFVGPLDGNNDPTGGRSVLELGGEFRARLWGDFGGVVFVEAGSVGEDPAPDFAEGVQLAAGLGFRYYSLAGPIRMDVGVPLNGRDADDAVQLYFSIGQAF